MNAILSLKVLLSKGTPMVPLNELSDFYSKHSRPRLPRTRRYDSQSAVERGGDSCVNARERARTHTSAWGLLRGVVWAKA